MLKSAGVIKKSGVRSSDEKIKLLNPALIRAPPPIFYLMCLSHAASAELEGVFPSDTLFLYHTLLFDK